MYHTLLMHQYFECLCLVCFVLDKPVPVPAPLSYKWILMLLVSEFMNSMDRIIQVNYLLKTHELIAKIISESFTPASSFVTQSC